MGGRWDRVANDYLDDEPRAAVPIEVNANQVRVVERFRDWITARLENRPRKRLLITGGNRRGGKSWIITALASAAAAAIPGAIIWLVSPTLKKRGELERYIKGHIPAAWRSYSSRDLRFRFVNGSTITNVTGEDAEAIKMGEADLVILNEPQMMGQDVLTYAAPAIIDTGGLLLFAGNPSRRRKGVWFTRLLRSVEEGKYDGGTVCRLDAKDNPDIDAVARSDVGRLMHLVDPEAARADDEGVFLEPGSFAYAEHFDEKRNTCPSFPDLVAVVTANVIKSRGGPSGYDTLVGADFQGWPFNCGIEVVAVGDPAKPAWYVRRALVAEGDEDFLLDEMSEAYGDRQPWVLTIGDASGSWQDAKHIKGRCSYDKFKARRWRIEPPRKKLTDRGDFPANPAREDRINIVNALLDAGRLIVCMDSAGDVAEDLAKCEVDPKGRPKGKHAHRPDGLGYALYWATPKSSKSGGAFHGASVPGARIGSGTKWF